MLELFAGIGACSKALTNLGVEHEIVDAVEIDKYAIKSFNAIHGTDFEPQDIQKWNKENICLKCKRLYSDAEGVLERDNFGDDDFCCPKCYNSLYRASFDFGYDNGVDLVMHGSPCFVAGTQILTSSGYKNIEDVVVGDSVLTDKQGWQTVEKIGGKMPTDLVAVKAQGSLLTKCTSSHPFLVMSRKRCWDSLSQKYVTTFSEPIWKQAGDLAKDDFVAVNTPMIEENPLELAEEQCWLLGRYVADGHVRHSKRPHRKNSYQYGVVYSIGANKVDEFKKHLNSYHASIYPHSKSVYRVVISSQTFVELIEKLKLGKGAINKTIPSTILNLPKNLAATFLDGYMSGDGCYYEETKLYSMTTISKTLALSFQRLVQKVYGVGANISFSPLPKVCSIEGRICKQHDQYSVHFYKENHSSARWVKIGDKIWYPIKKVVRIDPEMVFNLQVANDHSYTANNICVHNCQDYSLAGKGAGGDEGSGTRSSLMYETLRIVKNLKPKYVIWENVPAVLSKKHKHNFDNYLARMEGMGYSNSYQILNAKDYGIPQSRRRVFVVSTLLGGVGHDFTFPEGKLLETRLADLLDEQVDEKYFLSDEKVAGMKIKMPGTSYCLDANYSKGTTVEQYVKKHQRQLVPDRCIEVAQLDCKGYDAIKRVYAPEGCSPTLTTMGGGNREPKIVAMRGREPKVLTTKRTEYAKQIRKDYEAHKISEKRKNLQQLEPRKDNLANTLTSVQKDNMVLIPQATKTGYAECPVGGIVDLSYPNSSTRRGRVQNKGSISPTITANQSDISKVVSVSPIRIRKLTERECWKLMGFSDEDFEKASKVNSRTQLYKQAGNSIVVTVLEAILKQLLEKEKNG